MSRIKKSQAPVPKTTLPTGRLNTTVPLPILRVNTPQKKTVPEAIRSEIENFDIIAEYARIITQHSLSGQKECRRIEFTIEQLYAGITYYYKGDYLDKIFVSLRQDSNKIRVNVEKGQEVILYHFPIEEGKQMVLGLIRLLQKDS